MAPQKCALSKSPEPMIMLHSKTSKVVDGINVANQLMLKCGDCLELSRWAHYNHKGPFKWKERARRVRVREGNGKM